MKDFQRLDKLLSNSGIGSRSDVRKIIKAGRVAVNGAAEKAADAKIEETAEILIDGKAFIYKKHIYIMMNKPFGVLSASEDQRDETVIDLLPEHLKRRGLFPAGRLDKDTEGLLIITDDGVLAHNMLSPKKHISKTYFARIEGEVSDADIAAFKKGIVLEEGFKCLPSELTILTSGFISEIELTIYEGKFHQIKRMFLARDKRVAYLKRICMGKLKLDVTLKSGEARELTKEEKNLLLS